MKKFIIDLKVNHKKYLIKLACLILGIYIFSLSIAVYAVTAVGASQVDFTNFAILGIFSKWDMSTGLVNLDSYKWALFALYGSLLVLSAIFLSVSIFRKYKKNKDKKLWLELVVLIVLDLIIIFTMPFAIDGQIAMLGAIGYNDWMIKTTVYQYRTIFFLIAYILYIVGLTFWVHSGWLISPYNSINTSFMKMTNLPFNTSRVLMDLLIFLPGLILLLVNPVAWELKGKFLLNYLNIGTIIFVFATGPILSKTLTMLNKVTKIY
ncbi:SPE_1075/MLC_0560 family membrane protein [Mycoplasma putrefaciens]|uniref:Transmembrane protein n=1 Tax=Mycoplasma putrefaciens Mput9231 TaxID=1292033 RepID=M9WD48_9MOLU|nr:hypothetical protein [Mycoplasma putrefaciens]AGJ91107.1 Hypothetical protein, predicted transmembrane protein [Mycoplasma putrefaciens Mput9231]